MDNQDNSRRILKVARPNNTNQTAPVVTIGSDLSILKRSVGSVLVEDQNSSKEMDILALLLARTNLVDPIGHTHEFYKPQNLQPIAHSMGKNRADNDLTKEEEEKRTKLDNGVNILNI